MKSVESIRHGRPGSKSGSKSLSFVALFFTCGIFTC